MTKYIDEISAQLYENLSENDCFTIGKVEIGGYHLIMIRVEKSSRWNFVQSTNTPYRRKGATNYKATQLVALEYENSTRNLMWPSY